jgi:hypothetical protein
MARKSKKPLPVDWETLDKELAIYAARLNTDFAGECMFRDLVDGNETCDPMEIIKGRLSFVEQAILDGRTQDAIGETACLIIDLVARIQIMTKATIAAKPRILESVRVSAGRELTNKTRRQKADLLSSDINLFVAERLKKRGARKQPSLTKIRRDAAVKFSVSERRVLNAQTGK